MGGAATRNPSGQDKRVLVDGAGAGLLPRGKKGGIQMDFKQFYLSAQGRVNRQQWWLKLVLPVTVISIILAFVDMATGRFDPETGVGLFSGIFGLLVLIPLIGAIWISSSSAS